ncbi:MAG: class I SAM-dependent methyltransferase [Pseudomonadota bacterium]
MAIENWSEAESGTFLDLGRYAVPERERQLALIVELVGAATAGGDVVDLCCGEGLATAALRAALPETVVQALDGSPAMLAATRAAAGDDLNLRTALIELEDDAWRRFDAPLRAVVSSLAVHHLDDGAKRVLFRDLHGALAPGGVFVLADLVAPTTIIGQRMAAAMWDDEVRRRALAMDGDERGFRAFEAADWNLYRQAQPDPVDRPSRLLDQLDWLRDAGFVDIELHWAMAGHVLLSGWKA